MSNDIEKDIFNHVSRDERTRYSAEQITGLLIDWVHPNSVIDVGCGVGTFLKLFEESGVHSILGVDSTTYVDPEYLEISKEKFIDCNLEQNFPDLPQRFDLALSLEVAEHLNPSVSEKFVENLTKLSDCVCFSAAIPGQGGVGHVNEQWLDFWIGLFERHHYQIIDCVRPKIWYDDKIFRWYRMNTVLFVKKDSDVYEELKAADIKTGSIPSVVHPEMYAFKLEQKNREIEKLTKKWKKAEKFNLLRIPRRLLKLFR